MNLKKSNLIINKKEILKNLGYHKKDHLVDPITLKDIDEGITVLLSTINIKYGIRYFDEFACFEDHVIIPSIDLIIKSHDLSRMLSHASKLAIIAVTLGSKIETINKRLMLTNPDKALIYDAIESHLIESASNKICQNICIQTKLFRKPRFSPGYGDLGLNLQGVIIDLLGGYKSTGLSVNKSHQLIPSKSITAFVGLFENQQNQQKSCQNCSLMNNCRYTEEGVYCYDQQRQSYN